MRIAESEAATSPTETAPRKLPAHDVARRTFPGAIPRTVSEKARRASSLQSAEIAPIPENRHEPLTSHSAGPATWLEELGLSPIEVLVLFCAVTGPAFAVAIFIFMNGN
jgi:hypothetical protein